jgi:hypothetical protein
MATRKPANNDKKFFDVSKPGKAMPPSSSRPTIVGHRTILKDPMVNADVDAGLENSAKPADPQEEKSVSTTAPTLKPISVSHVQDDSSLSEDTKTKDVEPVVSDTVEVDNTTEPEPTPKDETSEPSAKDESATTSKNTDKNAQSSDTTSDDITAEAEAVVTKGQETKEANKAAEALAARVAAAEKLIADKTYFVPVGPHQKKHSKKRASMVVVICLIGIILLAYLAIDSGMIKADIDLPVRLFRVE